MAKEIERKFSVVSNEWVQLVNSRVEMQQAYIFVEEGKSARIRIIDDNARLTMKFGMDILTRDEFEYDIPIVEAKELLKFKVGKLIEKTRYTTLVGKKTWEIDVFHGELDGLMIAEVELNSEEETFTLPEWVDEELTGLSAYYNINLALSGLPGGESEAV